jgi:hypothetical protein
VHAQTARQSIDRLERCEDLDIGALDSGLLFGLPQRRFEQRVVLRLRLAAREPELTAVDAPRAAPKQDHAEHTRAVAEDPREDRARSLTRSMVRCGHPTKSLVLHGSSLLPACRRQSQSAAQRRAWPWTPVPTCRPASGQRAAARGQFLANEPMCADARVQRSTSASVGAIISYDGTANDALALGRLLARSGTRLEP